MKKVLDLITFINPSSSEYQPKSKTPNPPIWWSNLIFFISIHLIGIYGAIFISPIRTLSTLTIILTILSWQLATFGITIGYHRLWSHRSFKASIGLRWFLSIIGSLGFQGSIKWWVLRHRLHHRWTDSEHDPYNSKKGLFFSHMGWIFRKPKYEKLKLIDHSDLDQDPVVQFQHKHYISISLLVGFILPHLLSEYIFKCNRNSRFDGLIWAGFVARILIWHFTFLINSVAHYYGERSFDLDISARSNFLLAIFTGGEANHNYHHVFPKDYRNGPAYFDWDPSKWIVYLLHRYTNLIPKISYTDPEEVEEVRRRVLKITSSKRKDGRPSSFEDIHHISMLSSSSSSSEFEAEVESDPDGNLRHRHQVKSPTGKAMKVDRWKKDEMLIELLNYYQFSIGNHRLSTEDPELRQTIKSVDKLKILVIDDYLVDITNYFNAAQHPGGNVILSKFQLNLSCLKDLQELTRRLAPELSTNDDRHGIEIEQKNKSSLSRYTDFEQFKNLIKYKDCRDEFMFELNIHSSHAFRKMKSFRIARLI